MKTLFSVLLVIFFLGCTSPSPPSADCSLDPSVDSYASVRAQDMITPPPGWSAPQRLGINTDCWEDSSNLSPDGKKLYFVRYTGTDLLHDAIAGSFPGKLYAYGSEYPFTSVEKLTSILNVQLPPDPFAIGGVNISSQDVYYHSNQDYLNDQKGDTDIYQNGIRLPEPINSEFDEDDPYYCAAKGELYFWSKREGPNTIFVSKNGKVSALPAPINSGKGDMQPWLTPDCQSLYFASGRGQVNGLHLLEIYRSTRLGEDSWSEPELFLDGRIATGEPTLSDDGKRMTFVQMFQTPEGKYILDIFMMEKES